ncbi:syntaxin-binding protein 5 isoform X4 [Cherax quadricarinatus]|uniref:syntaxin-binding protein 5 isoform X4 n=1 Tax=Cherax quadricarinatus TaxID=27406 RepID=UPI00387E2B50
MKKFTLKHVFEGFRSTVQQPSSKPEHVSIVETLHQDHFQVAKTVRHGFPYQPTAVAFDPIQKVLAVGTKQGSIRLIGRPGVDVHVRHESEAAVLHLLFLINEGALVTATADDFIHLWNYRQKRPEIVHSLKFQRERITCLHLPFLSKWLYVGTERGNIHVVNIEVFHLSGYIVNWNKAIELSRKTHPGPVVHLSDCPVDPGKLLIGYESGQLVVWDLKSKTAEVRFQSAEPLKSVTWHHEGKQFMCCHTDGSLTTWMVKQTGPKPTSIIFPHAKTNKEGKQETCKSIQKVEWKCSKTGESFVIFSGGLTNDRAGRTPSITVIQGKTTTVLEMEHNVVDFTTLCETPYASEFAEPYALVVLLHNDLVVVDLHTQGYPCFENPYSMDLHESPVTCCTYLADCPADLIPAFYSVGARGHKRQGFSEREWPICGGEWGTMSCSYAEMIITGHADGSIKFWDASSVSLQVLYKLKTAKVFEKPKTRSIDGDEDPFAIQHIFLCPESRFLCVAGATSHVILFKYSKQETISEISCLEIPIVYDVYESGDCSPEYEFPPRPSLQVAHSPHHTSAAGENTNKKASDKKGPSQSQNNRKKPGASLDYFVPIHVRGGAQKKGSGYQAELVCLMPWVEGEPPGPITALAINSSYGLLSYGNENGLVIVDYIAKSCLLNMGTPDLYGAADPYQRVPRSPKRNESSKEEERCKSPSSDQKDASNCSSPVPGSCTTPVHTSTTSPPHCSNSSLNATYTVNITTATTATSTVSNTNCNGDRSCLKFFRSPFIIIDKLDGSFSRSRSSSISSLENISSEAIQCLSFVDSYTRKNDTQMAPTLWVGTSLGSVIQVMVSIPPPETRATTPATVSPSGTIFRLKGTVLAMSFLDCNGALIPYQYESWKDANKEKKLERTPTKSLVDNRMSPTNSGEQTWGDRQFVVIASEKVARVVALPSQNCVYKQIITEVSFVVKAEIIQIKDSVCLVCYIATGHISVFSLPSLRQLIYVDFLPLVDLSFQTRKTGIVDPMLSIWGQQMFVNEDTDQIARTFCFTNYGHGMYLCSPTEIQKFTLASDFCKDMQDMLGELFLPCDMPEAPKQSFFKGLFGGGISQLDREELFGEASGKGSRSVAKHVPGPTSQLESLNVRAGTVAGDINKTRMQLVERGQKLGELEERTGKMMNEAESFSSAAHQLMLKYKDKKWYQL